MKPLVSILIPAYNAQDWIADTIRSALDQTWSNKEIIVVDDGSKDGTLAVARQFAVPNVTVVTQKNQGAATARNKALELSRGDYLQWLDADDLLSPQKVERQMAAAIASGNKRTLLSSAWGYFMYRPGRAKFNRGPLWEDLEPLEWLLRKWEHNAHMQTATWLVSRELTELAGPWNTGISVDDDGEYFFRVVGVSERIKFVPESKVYYRVTTANRLSYIGASDRKMQAQLTAMKVQIGHLRKMSDDARSRRACVNYLQTWFHYFYPNRPDLVQQAQQMAAEMGGELRPPRLSWKYAWIQKLFGWDAAKSAQQRYNLCKSGLLRSWDHALFQFQKRTNHPHPIA